MYLELAEKGKNKRVTVNTYSRSGFVKKHTRKYPTLHENNLCDSKYHVYIHPSLNDGNGLFVREDYFDNLNDAQFENVMSEIEEHEDGIGKGSKGRREERRARRKERKENKITKNKDRNIRKNDKRKSKDESKKLKAEGKKARGEGKKAKGERGGLDFENIIDSVGGVVKDFTGKGTNNDSQNTDTAPTTDNNEPDTILGMPKTPVIIGGLALLGLGIYAITKK